MAFATVSAEMWSAVSLWLRRSTIHLNGLERSQQPLLTNSTIIGSIFVIFDGRPRATGRAISPSSDKRSRLSLRSSQMRNACSLKKHPEAEKLLARFPKTPAPASSAVRTWPVRRKNVRRSNMRRRARAVADSFTLADMPECQTKTPRLPRRTARLSASIAPAWRSALPIDKPLSRNACTRLDSGTFRYIRSQNAAIASSIPI